MLILARRLGESITIGNDIKIMVTRSQDGKCWLGVEAPRNVPVVRSELVKFEKDSFKGGVDIKYEA